MKSILEIRELILKDGFDNIPWETMGDVKVKKSPCENFAIFNYTPECTFKRRWNWLEKASRGMIFDVHTGECVARPFDKFFNWGENGFKRKKGLVEAYEKMDGSLGIMYRDYYDAKTKFKVATRGSFESDQAKWATKWLNDNCKRLENVPEELTLLFEIIYPQNRIVVDYQGLETLTLIGARCRVTGKDWFYDNFVGYARRGFTLPKVYRGVTTQELLDNKDSLTHNEEGYVLRFKDGSRCKVKGKNYMTLHKILHGISNREYVQTILFDDINKYLLEIPEELREEFEQTRDTVLGKFNEIKDIIVKLYKEAPKETRKELALFVKEHDETLIGPIFALHDGEDFEEVIKKRLLNNYRQFFGEGDG